MQELFNTQSLWYNATVGRTLSPMYCPRGNVGTWRRVNTAIYLQTDFLTSCSLLYQRTRQSWQENLDSYRQGTRWPWFNPGRWQCGWNVGRRLNSLDFCKKDNEGQWGALDRYGDGQWLEKCNHGWGILEIASKESGNQTRGALQERIHLIPDS